MRIVVESFEFITIFFEIQDYNLNNHMFTKITREKEGKEKEITYKIVLKEHVNEINH